ARRDPASVPPQASRKPAARARPAAGRSGVRSRDPRSVDWFNRLGGCALGNGQAQGKPAHLAAAPIAAGDRGHETLARVLDSQFPELSPSGTRSVAVGTALVTTDAIERGSVDNDKSGQARCARRVLA